MTDEPTMPPGAHVAMCLRLMPVEARSDLLLWCGRVARDSEEPVIREVIAALGVDVLASINESASNEAASVEWPGEDG